MSMINVNGCDYYYEVLDVENPVGTIVFSHGLLWTSNIFGRQIEHFKDRFRVVFYDHRGHGRTAGSEAGYSMDELYSDTVTLIKELKLGSVHFVGHSMGTFIGIRLAARNPDLLRSLILIGASAQREKKALKYWLLIGIVKCFGIGSVMGRVMKIMFSKKYLSSSDRASEKMIWRKELQSNSKKIIPAVKGVIQRQGVEEELKKIQCPTLIITASEDKATVPPKGDLINKNVQHSQLRYIQGSGHMSTIEEPDQVNRIIEDFLLGLKV